VLVFPSNEWFDAVRHVFNADESNRGAGGGTCDATVGIKFQEQAFLLAFEGFECSGVTRVEVNALAEADFYMDMEPSEWREMLSNIAENGGADLDHTLNTLDLDSENGMARSWADDQYRQDLFYRYNQTFQYFFDASSQIETRFEALKTPAEDG
jgi:hypothetical protein